MKKSINLNCDLGEGGAYDSEIMPLISSCNIACGGHVGDQNRIFTALKLAVEHKVLVGAHPSFPDLINFGRVKLQMSKSDLKESLHQQLSDFFKIAKDLQVTGHHVKPHGALYHEVASNPEIAELFLHVVNSFSDEIVLYTAPNSELTKLNLSPNRIYKEVFADRAYHENGSLVSRTQKGAVLSEKEQVKEQVLHLAKDKQVKSIEGSWIKLDFDTICFHSDSPNALENLKAVKQMLKENEIQIQKANA